MPCLLQTASHSTIRTKPTTRGAVAIFRNILAFAALWGSFSSAARCEDWEAFELPVKLTVGYAVRAIDMNRDQKLDIAIVDSKRVLWLENPTWQEHEIFATPEAAADNVCFAPHDVDGDGLMDFALGADWQPNNTMAGGSIGWLHQQPAGKWTYHPLANEPTTHRMHWVQLTPGAKSLVVGPLKGLRTQPPGFDQSGVRLIALTPKTNPTEAWQQQVLTDQLHVMHNFDISQIRGSPAASASAPSEFVPAEILCASYEGVTWLQFNSEGKLNSATRLGSGQETAAPARGSSEIRTGRLAGKRPYLATIEPWHGDKVVVYLAPENWSAANVLWERIVVDDQLAWGHAIACANIDDDPEEELIVGVRDNQSDVHRCGVRVYDPTDASGKVWNRRLIDAGGVAVEDLVLADLDSDGRQDIIAVGRATHNAKIYSRR